MTISARGHLDVSARRILSKLRRHPMLIARAFNAGMAHQARDKLIARAREMKAAGGCDRVALGEVVTEARLCNRVVIWFLCSLNRKPRPPYRDTQGDA